jgi:hypothetical protein
MVSQNEILDAAASWYMRKFPEAFDGYDDAYNHAKEVFESAEEIDQVTLLDDGVESVPEFFQSFDVDYWED